MADWRVYGILSVLALVGGLGLWMGSHNQSREKQTDNAKKYLFFLLLLVCMVGAIQLGTPVYRILIAIISIFCVLEISAVLKMLLAQKNWRWALITCFAYAVLFVGFIFSYIWGMQHVLFIYVNVVVFDAFSQVCGQLFGKRKLVPKLSPAKTWEGLLGGAAFMAVTFYFLREGAHGNPLVLYFFILIAAVCGDLLASAVKRQAGLKDFSKWLPGQGGFMDRYDSLVFVFGVYFLWLLLEGMVYGI